jgi:putative spermidine/putrescine transport system permease protein
MTERIDRASRSLILSWPALTIVSLVAIPFLLLLQVSVGHHDPSGLWSPGFDLANFALLADPILLRTLAYSAGLAILVAIVCTAIAFPLTYLITRMKRRRQIAWLILLLSTLSLSEVLVAFAWQVMLAKRIGLSEIFVVLGLLSEPQSLSPGFGAVVSCLIYLVMPITVLLLYPGLSRLDRDLIEAAQTMGASNRTIFLTVVLPMLRGPIISSAILVAVFTIGTYVTPSVLGQPQQWTIAVLISRTALSDGNLPGAAAMALLLLAVTLALTGGTILLGRKKESGT